MILTIAIENTDTIIGGFEGEERLFVEHISTHGTRTELEYMMSLQFVFDLHGKRRDEVSGVILSSVVPHMTDMLRKALRRMLQLEPLVIGPGVKSGLSIVTDQPAQLGSDMVACAVAGTAKYETPLLIVNMGTATTISVINEKKQYVGGVIMPGIETASQALAKEAAQLPEIGLRAPKKVIGANTIASMNSGMIYGHAASVDGLLQRIQNELQTPVKQIVLTGAYANYITAYCESEMKLDAYLLLDGLRIIYEKNQK